MSRLKASLVLLVGIPCLAYGLGSWMLVRFEEDVPTEKGVVKVYFLNKETWTETLWLTHSPQRIYFECRLYFLFHQDNEFMRTLFISSGTVYLSLRIMVTSQSVHLSFPFSVFVVIVAIVILIIIGACLMQIVDSLSSWLQNVSHPRKLNPNNTGSCPTANNSGKKD